MRVWVTRTRPGADQTAGRLRGLGLDPVVDPVLEPRALDADLHIAGFDALAFSSPNGVRFFVDRSRERALTAYAVGDATAEALRAAGFARVVSAGGDASALAEALIADRPGRVLHLGPTRPAGDLPALAATGGVEVVARPIYETVERRPAAALAARPDALLIHSPRAAEIVARLTPSDLLASLQAFAISEAAAAPLKGRVRALSWAPFPDEASLLKLCAQSLSEGGA